MKSLFIKITVGLIVTAVLGIFMSQYFSITTLNFKDISGIRNNRSFKNLTILNEENKPLCTHGLLREIYAREKNFPGGGEWITVKESEKNQRVQWMDIWRDILPDLMECQMDTSQFVSNKWYLPKSCRLRNRYLYRNELLKCLQQSDVKYMAVIGDSNGQKYSIALVSLIQDILNATCTKMKVAFGGNPVKTIDPEYFLTIDKTRDELLTDDLIEVTKSVTYFNMTRLRWCRHCFDTLWKCQYKESLNNKTHDRKVYVENLGLDLLQLNLLNVTIKNQGNTTSYTYLEYLMKQYLPLRKLDIFFILPPFIHMKKIDPQEVKPTIESFVQLVHSNLPKTKIYWMPSFRQHEPLVPKKRKNVKYFGKLASARIEEMNQAMFEILKPQLLNASSNAFAFWDLFDVHDRLNGWICDGAHMLPVWYMKIMAQTLEIHCNSVTSSLTISSSSSKFLSATI